MWLWRYIGRSLLVVAVWSSSWLYRINLGGIGIVSRKHRHGAAANLRTIKEQRRNGSITARGDMLAEVIRKAILWIYRAYIIVAQLAGKEILYIRHLSTAPRNKHNR